jgi:hypothetical protein
MPALCLLHMEEHHPGVGTDSLGCHVDVGDRATIKIEKDNWIPSTRPEMLRTLSQLTDNQMVCSLIESDSLAWNTAWVNETFDETIVVQILQILISRWGGGDFLSWPHNCLGMYIIRSAYHMES